MTGGGGGGDGPANDNVEVPAAANDNVEVPEPANDNVDPDATEGAGGEGPNEGPLVEGGAGVVEDPNESAAADVPPGEPVRDGVRVGGEDSPAESDDQTDSESGPGDGGDAEALDSNEDGERTISWFDALGVVTSLLVSSHGYDVQSQINQTKDDLYEISMTVSRPQSGDSEIVRALSPKEERLRTKLESLLEEADELERAEKERELEDLAPKPSAPKLPSAPEPPGPKPPSGPRSAEPGPPESDARPRGRRGQAANDNEPAGGEAPNETDD